MNAPLVHAELYPYWNTYEVLGLTVTSLRLNEHASYAVSQEGPTYYVSLPGRGQRKCWNRAEVERICRDHYEQLEAAPEPTNRDYGSEWDREASRGDREYQFAKEQA